MTKHIKDFSFAEQAMTFDRHIKASIPGYIELTKRTLRYSPRFVQPHSNVYDIGCSSGRTLAGISRTNGPSRNGVSYVGIDCEPGFEPLWRKHRAPGLRFVCGDTRDLPLESASLVISHFIVQFILPKDKRRCCAASMTVWLKVVP